MVCISVIWMTWIRPMAAENSTPQQIGLMPPKLQMLLRA